MMKRIGQREHKLRDLTAWKDDAYNILKDEKTHEICSMSSNKEKKIYHLMNAKDTLPLQLIKLETVEETLQAKVYHLECELKRQSDKMETMSERHKSEMAKKSSENTRSTPKR